MAIAETPKRRFGWSDYRNWNDGERWELIDGRPFCMSPAPSSRHQMIVGRLFGHLYQHFSGRADEPACEPILSPIDVKLSDQDVVQPDVIVVCDPSQLRPTHVEGPPTLAIEVLSPSTLRHDRVRKLRLYAAAGIGEYWLVQPYPALVEVLELRDAHYTIASTYTESDTLVSPSFPELSIELEEIFRLPIPPSRQIDEIRESAPPYDSPVH